MKKKPQCSPNQEASPQALRLGLLAARHVRDATCGSRAGRLPADRDPKLRHVREVGSAQLAGAVLLHEVHLLRRPFARPPSFDPSLQRAQLPVRKRSG